MEKKQNRLRNCRVKRVDSHVRRIDAKNFEKEETEEIKARRKIENVTIREKNERKGRGDKIS